jgi:hypothetical protein
MHKLGFRVALPLLAGWFSCASAVANDWEGSWVGSWDSSDRSTTLEIRAGRIASYNHVGFPCSVTSAYVRDNQISMVLQPNNVGIKLFLRSDGTMDGYYEDDMDVVAAVRMQRASGSSSRTSCDLELVDLHGSSS